MRPKIVAPLYRRKDTKTQSAVSLISFDYDGIRDEYVLDAAWWDVSNPADPKPLGIRENLRIPLKTWQHEWETFKVDKS